MSSEPDLTPSGIKPTCTDPHHYETRQETCEAARSARVQMDGGAWGKGQHARLDGQSPRHSSAQGCQPQPAGALVGRAGPTRATAAPSLRRLQSPLPMRRGTLLYRVSLCVSAWDRSCSPGSCTPQGPPYTAEAPPWCRSQLGPTPHGGDPCLPQLHGGPSECSSAHSTVHQPAALGLCSCHLTLSSPHYY